MEKNKSDKGDNANWNFVSLDPVANLYSFSSGIELVDLHGSNNYNLVVADLGSGFKDMKLKVLKEVTVVQEHAIIDVPTGIVAVFMDNNEPRIPGVIVGSGPSLYVYKNLRPFYKYNLPLLDVNPEEKELWYRASEYEIKSEALYDELQKLDCNLTVQSLNYLDQGDSESRQQFLDDYRSTPLKHETVVTCLAKLQKSMQESDAIASVVVGTENKQILIVDSEGFTLLKTFTLPSVPCFISVSGLYDVGFFIYVACRDGKVYGCKRDSPDPKLLFEVSAQMVGMVRVRKQLVVATMDRRLSCHSVKGGKRLWQVDLGEDVVCLALMDHKSRGFKAVLVGLADGHVLIYNDNNLVDRIELQDIPTALCFGKYGTDPACLIAILASGAIQILTLKRNTEYSDTGIVSAPSVSQRTKLEIPKKSQLFVDQTVRERDNYRDMFQNFQYDLRRMRLSAAKSYHKSLDIKAAPLSDDPQMPLSLTASVFGIGPRFKMVLKLVNTASCTPQDPKLAAPLKLVFRYPSDVYDVTPRIVSLPALVPELKYQFAVTVQCLVTDSPVQDDVTAMVCGPGRTEPLVTAIISMPASSGTNFFD